MSRKIMGVSVTLFQEFSWRQCKKFRFFFKKSAIFLFRQACLVWTNFFELLIFNVFGLKRGSGKINTRIDWSK